MPIACDYSVSQKIHKETGLLLKPAVLARTLHKWLGLLIGLQILIWLASGLYMVVVDIDFIHGDPLVKNMQQTVAVPEAPVPGMAALRAKYPNATHIGLRPVMGQTFYTVTTTNDRYLFDPGTGDIRSPLNEDTARQIAEYHFDGDAPILKASLITENPPMEIQTRPLPLWRIDFDDRFSTSFYIDPYTGALATRRHQYWRIFDFLWMLHIMDYEDRADAHNRLLIFAQISGLSFAITGLWLLFYSFSGRRKNRLAGK
jgi:uncharacterized iron-regulated membrane protein